MILTNRNLIVCACYWLRLRTGVRELSKIALVFKYAGQYNRLKRLFFLNHSKFYNHMNKKTVLFILFLLFSSMGCSKKHIAAQWAIVWAENMFSEAYEMRHDKTKLSKRIRLYKDSCDQFVAAYHADRKVFTLTRIDSAVMACAWAENQDAKNLMQNFEIDYIQSHPTEAEYGDAMPPMSFE